MFRAIHAAAAGWSSSLRNSNVFYALLYNVSSSLASSIATGQFLATYIYSLPGQTNDDVGYIAAATGIAMLLTAAPIGYATDAYGRSRVLTVAAALGSASCVLFLIALLRDDMRLLYAASVLYGAFSAASSAPVATLLADSATRGERTRVLVWNYVATLAASAGGPALCTIFFWRLGNEWATPVLRSILLAGVAMLATSNVLLLAFDDAHAVGAGEEDTPLLQRSDEQPTASLNAAPSTPPVRAACCVSLSASSSAIPYVIFASDFCIAVGAGMTVQFFALFFANDYQLSPLAVSAIYALTPLFIAVLSACALPLSNVIGRAWASVLFDALGTACIVALSFNIPATAGVPLYMLRTAAMNASYPTQRAIMMDAVPKSDRGKWNALESVTAFTWTGSAALGGWLIDSHDYRYSFRITSYFYVAGTMILLLLVPLTANGKGRPAVAVDGEHADENTKLLAAEEGGR